METSQHIIYILIILYPHRVPSLLLPAPLPISLSLCSTSFVAASCWACWLSDLEHRLVNNGFIINANHLYNLACLNNIFSSNHFDAHTYLSFSEDVACIGIKMLENSPNHARMFAY